MSGAGRIACCPVCDGALTVHRHSWLRRCAQCGCLASTLEITINSDRSALNEALRGEALYPMRRAASPVVLDALERAGLRRRSTILDVGCAHGWFLREALARGYQAVGLEPDRTIAEMACRQGADVRIGTFPEALATADCFDAIVFNDVLEHLPDVSGAIAAVRKHLRPRGLFVANLPLASGFFYRVADALDRVGVSGPFDRMWQRRFPSPHKFYFTASQLVRLSERYGFKLRVRTDLPSVRAAGLWQRLRYDRGNDVILAAAIWPVVLATIPLSRMLPQDIGLFVFESGEGRA